MKVRNYLIICGNIPVNLSFSYNSCRFVKQKQIFMGLSAKSTSESLKHLCSLLDFNKKVYFSRFGDGEIYTMLGKDCLEHTASKTLSAELKLTIDIDDPLYLRAVGMNYPIEQGMIHGVFAPYMDNFQLEKDIAENFHVKDGTVFESQILFHYLSIFKPQDMIWFLDKYVRPKKKMFVGGTPKDIAEKLYGKIDVYIQTPPKNAYYKMDEWFGEVIEKAKDVEVIIPSVGVTSNIINYRLWNAGVEAHVLDIGSIVDAVHGSGSRKWIRLMGHRVNNVLLPEHQNKSIGFKLKYLAREIFYKIRLLRKGKKWRVPY
jgi:hypothetical protein